MELKPQFIVARLTKLGKSKSGLAKAMGVSNSAVSDLLKNKREIKVRELPKINKYLELQNVPVMGMIGAGAVIEPDFEQVPPEGLETVEIPFPMTDEMVGFRVKGDSMYPRYDEGDVIVCYSEQRFGLDHYFNKEVAVRTAEGRRYLKTLRRGKGRLCNLASFNATKDIENVKVAWVGEVFVTVRADQVKKLGIRSRGKAAE